jgi:diguanylate cyclase (GGDEF)-like protein
MDDLKRQSILDPLTQLLNRRGLHQVSERELSRCGRSGQSLALAVADIDHFKRLNDTFGHTAGDLILRDIAGILQELVRRSDCVARIGGEEFVILFPESDPDHALKLVERLRETVEIRDFPIRDNTVRVTVSFGITTTRGRTDISLDKLVEEADASLYAAKQAGRNRTQLFVPPGLPAAAG